MVSFWVRELVFEIDGLRIHQRHDVHLFPQRQRFHDSTWLVDDDLRESKVVVPDGVREGAGVVRWLVFDRGHALGNYTLSLFISLFLTFFVSFFLPFHLCLPFSLFSSTLFTPFPYLYFPFSLLFPHPFLSPSLTPKPIHPPFLLPPPFSPPHLSPLALTLSFHLILPSPPSSRPQSHPPSPSPHSSSLPSSPLLVSSHFPPLFPPLSLSFSFHPHISPYPLPLLFLTPPPFPHSPFSLPYPFPSPFPSPSTPLPLPYPSSPSTPFPSPLPLPLSLPPYTGDTSRASPSERRDRTGIWPRSRRRPSRRPRPRCKAAPNSNPRESRGEQFPDHGVPPDGVPLQLADEPQETRAPVHSQAGQGVLDGVEDVELGADEDAGEGGSPRIESRKMVMGRESETRERSLGMPSPLSSESTGRTRVLATFQKGFDRMNSDVILARRVGRRRKMGLLGSFFFDRQTEQEIGLLA
ncbi:hypothetical protein C7M84_015817 [Penaeus vannamei]|uniref:Uncharacterized protein n=1 Tax=Penaeus vannamei TaxID=6689 RepID=A0A3R7LW96_PENVA|nr:hypothetical protein C7M84_015817 [Penaeus vannamei]